MDDLGEGWRGERRVRLLEAASRVFARSAYEQASMDEIAQEAGVGKPTLYRYFPSKDALFAAVFVDALDDLEERLDAVLRSRRDSASRLRGLVSALVPTVRQHLVSLRLLGEDAAVADQSKRRVFRERRARIAGFIARALEEGMRAGEIRPVDPIRTAHLVIGMVWSGSAASSGEEDAVLAASIADLLLNGLVGPGGARQARPWDAQGSEPPGRSAGSRAREAVSP